MKKAKIRNIISGEIIDVYATTEHPDSSYGQSVWVDDNHQSYGIVGCPLFGYEFVELDEDEIS